MAGKARMCIVAAVICLALMALAIGPGRSQAKATYTTEFDAALTVTSTT